MDLTEFGTEPAPDARNNGDQRNFYRAPGYYAAEAGNRPVQWKVVQSGVFEICGVTSQRLPAGAYGLDLSDFYVA